MSDFITLTCPNCGGRLQITQDVERFACMFCGVEHLVRRGGGIVSLSPVVEGLAKVQSGVERAASELAIHRLESEITALQLQLTSLDQRLQQGLADLASDYVTKETQLSTATLPLKIKTPVYVKWFTGRPLWKSLLWGFFGLSMIACVLLYVITPSDSTGTKEGVNSGTTNADKTSMSDGEAVSILSIGCLAYPLSLLFLFYAAFATRSYVRNYELKLQQARKEELQRLSIGHDSKRANLLREIQTKRAPIEAEINKKRQQLAEHRRVVGG